MMVCKGECRRTDDQEGGMVVKDRAVPVVRRWRVESILVAVQIEECRAQRSKVTN